MLGLGQCASIAASYAHYGIRTAQSVPATFRSDREALYTSAGTTDFSPHTLSLEQLWTSMAGLGPPFWAPTVWEQLGPAVDRVRRRIPPEDAHAAMEWSSRQPFPLALASNSTRSIASWRALGDVLLQFPGGWEAPATQEETPEDRELRSQPQG